MIVEIKEPAINAIIDESKTKTIEVNIAIPGKSAYELAILGGYTGTLEEYELEMANIGNKVDKVPGKELIDTTKIEKLDDIEAGAEVNNISDINAVDLTDGGATTLHKHSYDNLDDTPTIPTALSDLSEDTTHRLVTDTEKSNWNGKEDALGYTAENIANKSTSITTDGASDTKYPSAKAVKDYADTKQVSGSYEVTTNKNANNGYAGLDGGGKVPLTQLPGTLLIYKGVWNATTNTPILTTPDLTKAGQVYNVGTAGTQFGIDFKLGDWAIYNDLGVLEKSDNSDDVTSVNGQQGAVVLTTDNIADYTDKRYVTDAQKLLFANINQDVKTTASPTFAGLTVDTNTLHVDKTNDRVGIGTISPTLAKLQIEAGNGIVGQYINGGTTIGTDLLKLKANASTQRLILEGVGGTVQTFLEAGSSIGLFGTVTNHDFRIRTNYVDRMTFDTAGNVGINESTPTAQLQINASSATTKCLTLKTAVSQTADIMSIVNSSGTEIQFISSRGVHYHLYGIANIGGLEKAYVNTATTGTIVSRNIADANSALIVNQVNASSTGLITNFQFGGVSKAVIDKDGNVGIGIDAPTIKLHINTTKTSSVIAGFYNGLDTVGEEALIHIGRSATNYGVMLGATPEVSAPGIQDHSFIIKTNPTTGTGHLERFRVSSNGDVGINSTSPDAQLHINTKDATTRGLLVKGFTGQSANLFEAQNSAGSILSYFNNTGQLIAPSIYSNDLVNQSSINNAYINLTTTGTKITRNIADAGVVLKAINQNASSTGDIAQFINSATAVGTYVKSTGALGIKNDLYMVGKDSSGTLELNMFKTNTSNQIETGSDLVLGTIEAEQDSGAITLFNMPVSAVTAGTEMSSTFKIGGTNVLKVYAEANGTGSVQNTKIIATGAVIGTSTDNSTFEADGTLKFNGTATVYNDLMISVANLRSGATPPTFAVFQNGVYANRFDNANTHIVYGSVEIQHDYKEGTDLEVHIHWSPSTTDTGNARFTYEYTVANMTTGTFGTTTTISAVQAGSGVVNRHQYLTIGTISGTGRKVGDVISFAFTRTGSDALDTFTGNAFVHQVGIHYECDSTGSRTQSGK